MSFSLQHAESESEVRKLASGRFAWWLKLHGRIVASGNCGTYNEALAALKAWLEHHRGATA